MRDLFSKRRQVEEHEDSSTGVARPPAQVDRLVISESVLQQTLVGLALGHSREMLSYWIGAPITSSNTEVTAFVTTVAFPKTYSTYNQFQVFEGQMGLITSWCATRSLWVLAQVHSHPTDEPHSEADETWPASHRKGFFSVIIPFFAQQSSVRTPHWRAYESLGGGSWQQIDPEERFQVLPQIWLPPQ